MKVNVIKKIRDMEIDFDKLIPLLEILSNMNDKDFRKSYMFLKNERDRDIFVDVLCNSIKNNRSVDDVCKVISKLKDLYYNERALSLVLEPSVYRFRTLEEQLF